MDWNRVLYCGSSIGHRADPGFKHLPGLHSCWFLCCLRLSLSFQCAILSPAFKVREFCITDLVPYSITLRWKALDDGAGYVLPPWFCGTEVEPVALCS